MKSRDGPFGFSPIIGRYCGQQNPPYIRSSSRYLWIKFVRMVNWKRWDFLRATISQQVHTVLSSLYALSVMFTIVTDWLIIKPASFLAFGGWSFRVLEPVFTHWPQGIVILCMSTWIPDAISNYSTKSMLLIHI